MLSSKNIDFLFNIKPRCEMLNFQKPCRVNYKSFNKNKQNNNNKQFFSVYLIELTSAVHRKCQIGSVYVS